MTFTKWVRFGVAFIAAAITPGGTEAALFPGEAVATCYSDEKTNGPVVATFDIRDPVAHSAPLGSTNMPWNLPHRLTWSRADLQGNEVFGIALDNAPNPNIYLTSTAIYKSFAVNQSAPGTGKVFKLDGTSGAVTVFATLPQGSNPNGQGLGNIAYDAPNHQFFVTDFYDGKVHRISSAGLLLGSYDPFQAFGSYANTPGGFAPLGERLWGVGTFEGRLYFARWNRDSISGPANEVWSIALAPFGVPVGQPRLEVAVPGNMPVADIEFAPDGRMLLAQRTMETPSGEAHTGAHKSELLEYKWLSGVWMPSGKVFALGEPSSLPRSAAGGADYVCPMGSSGELVVGTGDALIFPGPAAYGFQLMPATGGNKNTSYVVDLDGLTSIQDKTQIGDVDIYNTCDRKCSELVSVKVLCKTDGSGDFTVTFQIKNRSAATVYHAFLVPQGNFTATPNYFSLGTNGLASGAVSQVFQTTVHGAASGQQVTFDVTLHNQELEECCATRQTITLPRCNCAQIVGAQTLSCHPSPSGPTYSYTFSLQNLYTSMTPAYVLITPETPTTATFAPSVIPYAGSPQTITTAIGHVSPGQQVCFRASLHTANFRTCCSIRQCVIVPLNGAPGGCPKSHGLEVDLTTGFDQNSGAPIPARFADDDWKITSPAPVRPALVIAAPNSNWAAPVAGSQWIGSEAEFGTSIPGVIDYRLERCFCLDASARNIQLNLRFQADDTARVLLNNQPLSPFGGGYAGTPLTVQRTGAAGDGLFVAGQNCVQIELRDTGAAVTGLTLGGRITAPIGGCH